MSRSDKQFSRKTWWGPVWRDLVVDTRAKHYKEMRNALWLFVYFIIHADRRSGSLSRRYETIVQDMGIKKRTVRNWLLRLRKAGYIKIERSRGSSAIYIHIQRWKPILGTQRSP